MRHQNSSKKINQYLKFLIMISNFDFSISLLPDIAQKCFSTPDGATDPTFQMRYVSAIQHLCSRRYQSNNLGCIFLGHPVQKLFLNTTHPQYHWSPLSAHPLLWNMFPTYCHYSALSSCGHPQRFFLWNNLFSEYGVSSQCMEGCTKF